MDKEKILLANWIMCPDGTMIPSFHTHDFRTHQNDEDEESLSFNDGGTSYLRRGGESLS